ncbi:hypothetical protein C8R43DRAFT_1142707 [Mycena crocata]|nr:hypothetical protein C8R43DRAFT_1142707 [Mycena crocata]
MEYVNTACRAVRENSTASIRKLPDPDMLVSQFLTVRLPTILGDRAAIPRRTSECFSSDVPTCDPDRVWSIVIRPLSIVYNLETAFPQAWLNGAQSIIDPTDTNLRLPLWSRAFHWKILEIDEAQSSRRESKDWLPEDQHYILDHLGWNSHHAGAADGQVEWTRLITDEWLCGGNMNGIMYNIKQRVAANLLLLQHLSLSSSSKLRS